MSHAAETLTHLEPSLLWQQLSQQIDRFSLAWQEATSPPEISHFVPAAPMQLRRITLIELIKFDLERRWQGQHPTRLLEDYLQEFPELTAEGGVPCDLVYEEFHVRRQQGEQVDLSHYCERFPSRASELRRLIDLDAPTQSTVLVDSGKLPAFEPGQTVDDFELLSQLGRGAFATVFRARQTSMQRVVALKISRDRSFEPQTLAQLEHPNIVRVFDQRQLPDDRLRLLYMQYVPGGTLHGVLDYVRTHPAQRPSGATLLAAIDMELSQSGEQPPSDSLTRYKLSRATWPEVVCWMGARLAAALAHAHSHGILHRDIKPANVLVGADGQPRLADFNISCSKLDGVTPAAYFGGTLAYMSPEQLEAYNPAHDRQPDEIDGRADIYSLGMVLWELLTQTRPFSNLAMPADWSLALPAMTAFRQEGLPADDLRRVPGDCPAAVVEVLHKCLDPDPANRYQSAAELAHELDLCLQPRARAILRARNTWQSLLRRHPVAVTVGVGLQPNILMSVFNIVYNFSQIVGQLSPEAQRLFFGSQILAVNSIAYTIGLGYIVRTRWQLFGVLTRLARGEVVHPPPPLQLVRRCLRLGAATAAVSAILWGLSGFVFPSWMRFGAGEASQISAAHYIHFIVSNSLCGLIAATQSYYVVTFLSVRFCYPWLLQARPTDARELTELVTVARLGRIVLGVTLVAPFLALAALLLKDVEKDVIGAIAATGFIGCALAYWLDLLIRGDLAALAAAINPSGDTLMGADSVDALLTGSRR